MLNESIRVTSALHCYLCGRLGTLLYAGVRDRVFGAEGTWNLLVCQSCGLVWLHPRPVPDDLGKLYRNYFTHQPIPTTRGRLMALEESVRRLLLARSWGYSDAFDGGADGALTKLLSSFGALRETAAASVMWLHGSRRGQLLDVGAGTGDFLAWMRGLGWQGVGVETDFVAVERARRIHELDIVRGTLEQAGFPDGGFDAVTMSHVIEHVPNPIQTLAECNRVLAPAGRLVVATPNLASLGRQLFGRSWFAWSTPQHLFVFRPHSLRICAERAGLRVITVRTTARIARDIWQRSRLLWRDSFLRYETSSRVSRGLMLESLAFWLMENALSRLGPWGEEIVLVAAKGD